MTSPVTYGEAREGLRHSVRNGFDEMTTIAATGHSRRMAAYQRAGIGLIYGDDGHWVADHLDGDEKARAQVRADAAWSATHRHCPRSAHFVATAPGCFVRYRCPECGQNTSLHPSGKVMPHAVRINQPAAAR